MNIEYANMFNINILSIVLLFFWIAIIFAMCFCINKFCELEDENEIRYGQLSSTDDNIDSRNVYGALDY